MCSRWFLWGTRPSLMSNHSRFLKSDVRRLGGLVRRPLSRLQRHVEIQLKGNASFFQPMLTDWRSTPSDVRPARMCTDGDKPVDLYQRGTFGSCLSAIRARARATILPKVLPAIINPVSLLGELTRVWTIQTNGPSLRFRLRLSCTLVHGIQDIPSFIGNMLSNSM